MYFLETKLPRIAGKILHVASIGSESIAPVYMETCRESQWWLGQYDLSFACFSYFQVICASCVYLAVFTVASV